MCVFINVAKVIYTSQYRKVNFHLGSCDVCVINFQYSDIKHDTPLSNTALAQSTVLPSHCLCIVRESLPPNPMHLVLFVNVPKVLSLYEVQMIV